MLRSCVLSWKGSLDDHLPQVGFAYNNSYHATIPCVPFEALYGGKYRSPLCLDVVGQKTVLRPHCVHNTNDYVA